MKLVNFVSGIKRLKEKFQCLSTAFDVEILDYLGLFFNWEIRAIFVFAIICICSSDKLANMYSYGR